MNYLYILVLFEDDTATANDGMYMMYQKDYGGVDTGTLEGHDMNSDWQLFYWKRDGDLVFELPKFFDVMNGNSSDGEGFCNTCDVGFLNQETNSCQMVQISTGQDSIRMAVDTVIK